jgi:predicted DNA-binding protein (UPF0251 family)
MEMYNPIQYNTNSGMLYQACQMVPDMQQYNYVYPMQNSFQTFTPKMKKQSKRGYVQCELWKRQALIEKVDQEGMTIKDAAKVIGINYSTAKHIVKVYRKTGTVETKMMKRKRAKFSNTVKAMSTVDTDPEQSNSTTDCALEID